MTEVLRCQTCYLSLRVVSSAGTTFSCPNCQGIVNRQDKDP